MALLELNVYENALFSTSIPSLLYSLFSTFFYSLFYSLRSTCKSLVKLSSLSSQSLSSYTLLAVPRLSWALVSCSEPPLGLEGRRGLRTGQGHSTPWVP